MTTQELSNQLLLASEEGDRDKVINLIRSGANIETKNRHGFTILHYAASLRTNYLVAKAILTEIGVNKSLLDSQDIDGQTALHHAVMSGSGQIVKLLIIANANVNIKDELGHTPLHLASMNDHIHIIEMLLEAGANINAQDTTGRTSLHLATCKCKLSTVQYLLRKGADRTILNEEGCTALTLAISKNNTACIQCLKSS